MKVGDLVKLSAYGEKIVWLSVYSTKVGLVINTAFSPRYSREEYYVMFTDKTTETFFRKELKHAK